MAELRNAGRRENKTLDYWPLLRPALRGACGVRFGILPAQSGFRRNDDLIRDGGVHRWCAAMACAKPAKS
jgi:hypothetical protein